MFVFQWSDESLNVSNTTGQTCICFVEVISCKNPSSKTFFRRCYEGEPLKPPIKRLVIICGSDDLKKKS